MQLILQAYDLKLLYDVEAYATRHNAERVVDCAIRASTYQIACPSLILSHAGGQQKGQ